jgi:hypothetical protein
MVRVNAAIRLRVRCQRDHRCPGTGCCWCRSDDGPDLGGVRVAYSIGHEGMIASISAMRRMVSLRATTILP